MSGRGASPGTRFGVVLGAELFKLRRTLALWLVLIAPGLVVLFMVVNLLDRADALAGSDADAWGSYLQGGQAIWAIFMLPLLIALQTALLAGIEHGADGWKHLFALPVRRTDLVGAKLAAAVLLVLAASAALLLLLLLGGVLLGAARPVLGMAGTPPVADAAGPIARALAGSGLVLAIHLWIALRFRSTTLALGVGVAGTFFAVFAAGSTRMQLYPWALPIHASLGQGRPDLALALGLIGGLVVGGLLLRERARAEV